MKPITIVMQAFGPYCNRCQVDFSQLGKSKLFLITGPTGSGKTTILDAMSFALYGESTGSLRRWKEMRNTAAPSSLPTLTEVEFSLGEEVYRFARSYSQRTVKKRAGGTEIKTETEANCYHWEDGDWKLMESGPRVSAKAKELLGFTHDQFSQVIVLPQGEFRKLLVATSTEKEAILETLFATGRWKQVTAAVVAAADQLKRQLAAVSEERQNLLQLERAESLEQLGQQLTQLQSDLAQKKEQSLSLEQRRSAAQEALRQGLQIHGEAQRLSQAKERLAAIRQNSPQMEKLRATWKRAKQAAALHPYDRALRSAKEQQRQKQQAWRDAVQSLKEAENRCQAAEEAVKRLPSMQQQAEKTAEHIVLLTRSMEHAGRLESARQRQTELQTQLENLRGRQQSLSSQCKALDDRLQKANRYLQEQFDGVISRIPLLTARLQELQAAAKERDSAIRLEQEVRKAQKAYEAAKGDAAKASIASAAADNSYLLMEKAAQADAAYWLSQSLSPGQPCPVCGSTCHPMPACPAADVPTPQQLEACRAVRQQAAEALKQAESNRQSRQLIWENARSRWKEALDLFSRREMDSSALDAALQETSSQLEAANLENQKRPRYEKKRDEIQTQLRQKTEDLEKCRQEVSQMEQQLAAAQAARRELLQSLPDGGEDLASLQKQLAAAQQQSQSLKQEMESIQSSLQQAQLQRTRAKESHTAAQTAAQEADLLAENARREWENQCLNLHLSPEESIRDAYLPKEEMDGLEQRIAQYDRSLDITKSQVEELEQELSGVPLPDVDGLRKDLQAVEAEKSQLDTHLGSLQTRINSLERTCAQLEDCSKRMADLEGQYTRTGGLGQLLSGKNPLKTPIHQFVLGILLDDVVRTANVYLIRLSRGQYSLIRQDSQGGQGFRGLDLYVNDAHRGGTRSVKTLSGGELFLASLSLAFGLSDVVQSMAGGVHLDAIFIDEGFGTLDMETLEAAMRALDDIQASGRLVGIISHVRELRDRIPMRIEVSPDPSGGSTLQWKKDA